MSDFDTIFAAGADCLDKLQTQLVTLYLTSGKTSQVAAAVGEIETDVRSEDGGREAVKRVKILIRKTRLASIPATARFRVNDYDTADQRWIIERIGETDTEHIVTLTRTETVEHHRDSYRQR